MLHHTTRSRRNTPHDRIHPGNVVKSDAVVLWTRNGRQACSLDTSGRPSGRRRSEKKVEMLESWPQLEVGIIDQIAHIFVVKPKLRALAGSVYDHFLLLFLAWGLINDTVLRLPFDLRLTGSRPFVIVSRGARTACRAD